MIPLAGSKGWGRYLQRSLQCAFDAAGCEASDEMSRGMMAWIEGNANPFTAWKDACKASAAGKQPKNGLRPIPPSTVSTRLNALETAAFLANLNESLRCDARRLLGAFAPDRGEVIAMVDGMEANYWSHGWPSKRIAKENGRQNYATTPGADNTESNQCHTWLAVLLAWTHKGRTMKYPIHVELMAPWNRSPKTMIQIAKTALRRAAIRPGATVADAGLDSPEAREAATDPDVLLLHKVSNPLERNRWVKFPDGTLRTIQDLMREEVNAKTPVYNGFLPRQRRSYLYRLKAVRCLLGGVPVNLILEIALQAPARRTRTPKFQLDSKLSRAFVAPPNFSPAQALHVYALRRRIEDFFAQLPLAEPKPRCKIIQSHIAQQSSYFYRVAVAHAKHLARILGRTGPLPYPTRYATIKEAGQDLLDEWEPAMATAG